MTGATASWRSTPGTGSGTGWRPRAASISRSPPTATPSREPYLAPRQTDGVKWIVANKDVPLAILEIARRERRAGEYLRSLRGTRMDGLHSLSDPVPGAVNACRVVRQAVTRQPRSPGERVTQVRHRSRASRSTSTRRTRSCRAPRGCSRRCWRRWAASVAVTRDPARAERRRARVRARRRGRRADHPSQRRRAWTCSPAPGRCRPARSGGRRRRRPARRARPPPPPWWRPFRPTTRTALRPRVTSSPRRSRSSPAGTSAPCPSATGTTGCPTRRACSPPTPSSGSTSRPSTATWSSCARVLAPRLAALGLEPLPEPGWVWGDQGYAVALTHDLDNLWRWTRRGFAATGYRTARGVYAPRLGRRAPRARRRRRLARPPPPATHRSLLGLPADARRRGRPRRLVHLLRHRPAHAQARRQPAGGLPPAPPRGARAARPAPARDRPARQRRRPPRAGSAGRATARASHARRASRCTASATTTCAACTTRHCRCWSRPGSATTRASRSPSTRGSAAGAPSPSARTRWPRSAPST